ncbi:disulfide bond formation protein B [Candidatus Peregrinibacteria bacterium CG10_big_fil_rev_8_21_14_0_10_49_24]|nr:MAG: disulfide bond formation protein B [Candidatus Peregrinibacteria bacterium CG11_big_fil_rev_8_21_14_0_20_49_14]PIR50712.1 MAG: disulfide bond formation protein B [Candidatus Peregrinibacteria bacterium CG10_big_fil_rev_8_21_14_0_10_49_24]PJA68244.1 MAG: disulfide bond formation protein B [Candidatus Peregrinibacteria bacterium CG_4_9_14_3_um_filter_49_12]
MEPYDIISGLAILTIVGQIIASFLILCFIGSLAKISATKRVLDWVGNHATVLMIIVAAVATSGSLYFSEIALFAPCKDCWIQRIFMYPQAVLIAVALWRKDATIPYYILVLSLLGIAMSGEHYVEQWKAMLNPAEHDPLKPCDLSGVSCSATYIFEYGYITIPLMAGTAFLLNILGSVLMIRPRRKYK